MPEIMQGPGLGGIIREPAATLLARFGQPRLDTPEGDMRKLQFSAEACVLDIYLYPLAPGTEPVATWVEAGQAMALPWIGSPAYRRSRARADRYFRRLVARI
jgi:hypothetical protein